MTHWKRSGLASLLILQIPQLFIICYLHALPFPLLQLPPFLYYYFFACIFIDASLIPSNQLTGCLDGNHFNPFNSCSIRSLQYWNPDFSPCWSSSISCYARWRLEQGPYYNILRSTAGDIVFRAYILRPITSAWIYGMNDNLNIFVCYPNKDPEQILWIIIKGRVLLVFSLQNIITLFPTRETLECMECLDNDAVKWLLFWRKSRFLTIRNSSFPSISVYMILVFWQIAFWTDPSHVISILGISLF